MPRVTTVQDMIDGVQAQHEHLRGKPAPDVYLAVAALLGRPADRCAAVEDSTNGVRSAVAAGCHVIAVPRPEYPVDPLVLSTAALVLTSLADLDVRTVSELAAG